MFKKDVTLPLTVDLRSGKEDLRKARFRLVLRKSLIPLGALLLFDIPYNRLEQKRGKVSEERNEELTIYAEAIANIQLGLFIFSIVRVVLN